MKITENPNQIYKIQNACLVFGINNIVTFLKFLFADRNPLTSDRRI